MASSTTSSGGVIGAGGVETVSGTVGHGEFVKNVSTNGFNAGVAISHDNRCGLKSRFLKESISVDNVPAIELFNGWSFIGNDCHFFTGRVIAVTGSIIDNEFIQNVFVNSFNSDISIGDS